MQTTESPRSPAPRRLSAGSALALALVALPVGAADGLEQRATVHLWAAGIDSTTAGGAQTSIGFATILQSLNMAFMGAYELRQGLWSGGVDVVYLNAGADADGRVPVQTRFGGGVVDVSADVKTRGWVWDLFGARRVVQTDRFELDALLGLRYLELRLDFDLDLAAGRYGAAPRLTKSGVFRDGVVGAKGRVLLDGGWSLPYRVDIGAGDSDLTWQVNAGVAYARGRAEVALTYRHMAWELGAGALDDTSFSGPQASITWRF
jgi:hypothetical protein